jgi:hypothetical protein
LTETLRNKRKSNKTRTNKQIYEINKTKEGNGRKERKRKEYKDRKERKKTKGMEEKQKYSYIQETRKRKHFSLIPYFSFAYFLVVHSNFRGTEQYITTVSEITVHVLILRVFSKVTLIPFIVGLKTIRRLSVFSSGLQDLAVRMLLHLSCRW